MNTAYDYTRIRILSSSAGSISHEWARRTSERYFQHVKIKFVSPSGHVKFCLFYRYCWNSYIKQFFYSFSKQHNRAIKVVTYHKMPLTKINEWARRTSERYFQHVKIKFVSPSGHVKFCLFYRYCWNSYIKQFFYSFSKQHNRAIKVVTYHKMPLTKILWNPVIKI